MLPSLWLFPLLLFGAGSTEPLPDPPAAAVDLALARIAEARRLVRGLEHLWPGLSVEPPSIGVCLGESGAVLSEHPGSRGWTEIRAAGWRADCPWPEVTIDPSVRTGPDGRSLVLLSLQGPLRPFRLDGFSGESSGPGGAVGTGDAIAFIVKGLYDHWAAHRLPAAPPSPRLPGPAGADRREPGFACEEAGVLLAALEAPKAKHARRLLKRFSEIRNRRLEALGNRAPGYLFDERRSGLALYTVYQALRLGRHDPRAVDASLRELDPEYPSVLAPRLREELIHRLDGCVRGPDDPPGPGPVGFALSLLLDRTVHGWREELLATGAPLHELLPTSTVPPIRRR